MEFFVMSDPIGVVITGASGRMGQMLINTVAQSDRLKLVGAIERSGHPWLGQDIGLSMGMAEIGVTVEEDPLPSFSKANCVIDFTSPDATVEFAALAAQARIVHVIGTTGMDDKHFEKIASAARHATIIRAGNMSLGVNLLVKLTKLVSEALDDDFDIEIIEAHHNQKVDAPSGTALMLGEAAADGRDVDLKAATDVNRNGIVGSRKTGDIGFVSVRGGDIVGEHDVMFAATGERIYLRHIATDRSVFARGALKAALWGQGKPPGEYTMFDVLGLS